jgi:hypothetical protein
MLSSKRRSASIAGAALVTFGALGAAALATQGCSSSSSGPPDVGHFASSMASAFCGSLHSCCNAAHYQYDDGSCTAQMQDQFQTAADAVKHGKVVYHPQNVAACTKAIADWEGHCSNDAGLASTMPGTVSPVVAACWDVFTGIVPPGGSCLQSADCAISGPSDTAQCVPAPADGGAQGPGDLVCYLDKVETMVGGACTGHVVPQQNDFQIITCSPTIGYCDTSSSTDGSTGTCKAFAKVGDPCTSGMAVCDPAAAYCDFQSGACKALGAVGDPCGAGTGGNCTTGLYCDTMSSTCMQPQPAGSPCTSGRECTSMFCKQGIDDAGMFSGTCQDLGGGNVNPSPTDISPRSCGFGPGAAGPDDAGIVPPAMQVFRPSIR